MFLKKKSFGGPQPLGISYQTCLVPVSPCLAGATPASTTTSFPSSQDTPLSFPCKGIGVLCVSYLLLQILPCVLAFHHPNAQPDICSTKDNSLSGVNSASTS